jgi:protein-S-isoprenylcysteine O-methyltransferase Ste14
MGYLFQAAAIVAWWIAILASPRIYEIFAFAGVSRSLFIGFALPDLAGLVVLSALAFHFGNPLWRGATFGAFLYSGFLCLAWSLQTHSGYVGTTAMLLAVLFNLHLAFGQKLIRRNRTANITVILLKSGLQSVVIWAVTLFLIPAILLRSIDDELFRQDWGAEQAIAVAAFCLCSILGLSSGFVMAVRGLGTPAPFDAATKLVVTGPYAHVRNPMAIAGLGQGMAVALYSESFIVALYVLLGLLVWNYFIRPEEESDLENFFGEEFQSYRRDVRCWVPRWSPYRKNRMRNQGGEP